MADLREIGCIGQTDKHVYTETQAVLALASVLLEVSTILHGPCDEDTQDAMNELETVILARLATYASAASEDVPPP